MSLNSLLKMIAYPSHKFSFPEDVIQKIIILTVVSYALIAICFSLGIDSFVGEVSPLGYVLLFVSFSILANVLLFRLWGNFNLYTTITHIIFGVLCVYLMSSGGRISTGPLWCYIYPVSSFYLIGHRKASITCVLLTCIYAVILFVPGLPFVSTYAYPSLFKIRFLITLSAVTCIAYLLEYSRYHTQLELVNLSHELDRMSRTDELTGLSNRRDMYEWLKQESYRYERNKNPFSITICDVDHFKNINDCFGHDCGDFVLKTIGGILKDSVRKQDKIARWGGEEFLILHPETNLENAFVVAERMRKTIEQFLIRYQENEMHLTVSFGVATTSEDSTVEAVIKAADENLYQSKRSGRNRVVDGASHDTNLKESV